MTMTATAIAIELCDPAGTVVQRITYSTELRARVAHRLIQRQISSGSDRLMVIADNYIDRPEIIDRGAVASAVLHGVEDAPQRSDSVDYRARAAGEE
jgi:hypothetical protein